MSPAAADGCVFRNLAFGLYSRSGISYLRNTRFENSSVCDVNVGVFWAFNSVQRVTSVGSRMFVCEAVQWEEFGAPYLPWGPTFVRPPNNHIVIPALVGSYQLRRAAHSGPIAARR